MIERRNKRRRRFMLITRFPLRTYQGDVILCERSTLPTRRLNDVEVKEISLDDFVSELR